VRVQGERLGFLSDGAFFGETPILDAATTSAQLRQRTVTAVTDCKLVWIGQVGAKSQGPCVLCAIDPAVSTSPVPVGAQDSIEDLKTRYAELALRLRQCSRGADKPNRKGRGFKDTMNYVSKLVSVRKKAEGRIREKTMAKLGTVSCARLA
jgi:hypothetical protein